MSKDQLTSRFKVCGFEDLNDIDRYVEEALDELDIPGEFQGTIKVTFEYEEYEDAEYEQPPCKHDWYPVTDSMGSTVTGQRCEYCGKQEWT